MIVIKVGGGVSINLSGIAEDLRLLTSPAIVVLGANAIRDEIARKMSLQIQTLTSVSGVTSTYSNNELIDLMMMSYSGLRNKRFVELCQKNGINAIGLSGLDGRLVSGQRNSSIRVREGAKTIVVRDNSGKPKKINLELLSYFIAKKYLPVITVPIMDENGQAINTENDDIVALLAEELKAECVIHLIEAPGLLLERDKEESLIRTLSARDLEDLLSSSKGRIKRKIMSLSKLLEIGTKKVIVSDGRIDTPVQSALNGVGTILQ